MGDVMRIRRKKDIMRVKKITAMLLAGVLMTSTLTGCGVNKDATVNNEKSNISKLNLYYKLGKITKIEWSYDFE